MPKGVYTQPRPNPTPLGSHRSEEVRAKISQSHIGMEYSEEAKSNNSKAQKKRQQAMTVEEKAEISAKRLQTFKAKTEEERAEIRAKISMSLFGNTRAKGNHLSTEQKARVSMGLRNHYKEHPETKAKISVGVREYWKKHPEVRKRIDELGKTRVGELSSQFGNHPSEETRAKMRKARLGRSWPEETKQKLRNTLKKKWQNEEWAKKEQKRLNLAQNRYPNKPERLLLRLLNMVYPKQWRYTGDGSVWIGKWNPDFINVNGKKQLIEMYGEYWHKDDNSQDRIDCFKEFGFDALVIWEYELKDKDLVIEKIKAFSEG